MTQKQMIQLARVISWILDLPTRRMVAGGIADICEETNPNFDRQRFIIASGLEW